MLLLWMFEVMGGDCEITTLFLKKRWSYFNFGLCRQNLSCIYLQVLHGTNERCWLAEKISAIFIVRRYFGQVI